MALGSINTSGITVGSDGKLSVSGFSSGIDWKSLVEAQMKAKRAPAVQLETKMTKNTALTTAYSELKTKITSVTTALDALRGAPGSTTDVFKAKTATGTTAAAAGAPAEHAPSSIDSLIVASISSDAQNATHTFTIQQLAQAHQVRADSKTSVTTALTTLGVTAGTITINGQNVVVDADDTLADVRSKINNAGAGVTATVVSADATTHYLVLTANDTGVANEIVFGGNGTTLDDLGLTTGAGTVVKHELKEAKNAIIDVDGITGIERASNEIDDVISGVTLSLLKAEIDTEITLEVQPDLATIKTAIGDFVTAYNALRTYYDDQRTASDRNGDGTVGDSELGVLAYDTNLRDAVGKLGELVATSVASAGDGFESLSQIGVLVNQDFSLRIDDSIMDNKLLTGVDNIRKLFGFSSTVSDSRVTLLGRTSNTETGTYYLSISGTNGLGNILSANITETAGTGTGGADNGSALANAKTIAGLNTTGAYGLSMFFDTTAGMGAVDDIAITVSRGLADSFYDFFNDVTKATGQLDTRITELQTQNTTYQDRIDIIDSRLEVTRKTLETKFILMESAMARLQTVQSSLESYIAQNNKSS